MGICCYLRCDGSSAVVYRAEEGCGMATQDLPATITLTADTVATITVRGDYSRLAVRPLATGQIVFVRGDGTNPVIGADMNYCAPPIPAEETVVPAATDGGTTSLRLVSATAGMVFVDKPCGEH